MSVTWFCPHSMFFMPGLEYEPNIGTFMTQFCISLPNYVLT